MTSKNLPLVRAFALTLAFLAGPRCVGEVAGIEVAPAFRLPPAPDLVELDDGRPLRLVRAELGIAQVELVPCDSAVADLWGPSVARAHGERAGGGVVLDLIADGGRLRTLAPFPQPPGRYCAARIHLGPPEAGAPTYLFEALDGSTTVTIADSGLADAEIPFGDPLVLTEVGLVGLEFRLDPWAWPLDALDVAGLARRLARDAQASICVEDALC